MIKMKIALIYLNVTNLGDIVIFENAKYILEDILKKHNLTDCTIVPVDIGSASKRNLTDVSITWRLKAKIIVKFIGLLKRLGITNHFSKLTLPILKWRWHQTKDYLNYIQNEKDKLNDVDLILFGGGGLIKFHRQNFHFFLDDVTDFADKKNIPVVISSQGVEGYEEENPECMLLKNALNRNCVKFVSTRDDFEMLKNCYITNPHIETAAVCDPAFWSTETYHTQKKPVAPKKIGLNVIRTAIFREYMYPVNANLLAKTYKHLIEKLLKDGYQVELFSNGVEKDTLFIDQLFKRYPELKHNKNVSVAKPETTQQLVETIAGYDRYMAVRLHASIIGTVLGIPNISLVWNKKQSLFGEQVGMPQNYLFKPNFKSKIIYERLMAAQPYVMNDDYKNTVYTTVEKQVLKYIGNKF